MRRRGTWGWCVGLVLGTLAAPAASAAADEPGASAAAPDPRRAPAFRLSLDVDGPLLSLGAATAVAFFVLDEAPGGTCVPACDRARVNALDRPAAGLYSRAWGSVGDVATASTMLFTPLVLVLHEGLGPGLNDDLVVAESALMASALQVSLSYAVGRPRPRVYGDDAPLDERTDANASRSFFSGHTANVVAATVAGTRALLRLGKPGLAWAVFGLGMAGSTLVGVSRVLAGSHFPTDVLAGAAAGAGVGILVPALHGSHIQVTPTASPDGAGLRVGGLL